MKRVLTALTALTIVAACGADAPPFRPTASAGVSVGAGGVTPNANLGATNGSFSLGLGL